MLTSDIRLGVAENVSKAKIVGSCVYRSLRDVQQDGSSQPSLRQGPNAVCSIGGYGEVDDDDLAWSRLHPGAALVVYANLQRIGRERALKRTAGAGWIRLPLFGRGRKAGSRPIYPSDLGKKPSRFGNVDARR